MKKRVISAAVIIILLLACMPFEIPRVILLGLIGIACSYELCLSIDRELGIKVRAWVLYAYMCVLVVLALTHCGIMAYYSWFTFGICLALFSGMLHNDVSGRGTMYTLAGLAYPCFPLSYIIIISVSSRWAEALALGIISTLICDTFALLGGTRFGKHKVAPEISPNKSVEGCICGQLSSVITALLVWGLSKLYHPLPFFVCLVTAFAASAAGQIGDLAESMIKRFLQVKDMSDLIPGHGGVLDRVDSSLFAVPAAYFCLYAFGL